MPHSSASLSLPPPRRTEPQVNIWDQLCVTHHARSVGNTAMNNKNVPCNIHMLWKEGGKDNPKNRENFLRADIVVLFLITSNSTSREHRTRRGGGIAFSKCHISFWDLKLPDS